MTTVDRWTGREAKMLRQALRLSVRDFAAHLGVGVRTVNKWEARQADITPLPYMQEVLDTALARASDEVKARFAAATRADVPGHETAQLSGPLVRGGMLPVVVNGRLVFVPFDADTVASGGLNALLDELAAIGVAGDSTISPGERVQNRDVTGSALSELGLRGGSHDPTGTNESSLELATLLNDLTADRFPILGNGEVRGVGVSAFEGASLAERAEVLLRLFLELDDELGGDVLYLPLSRYVSRLGASVEQESADGLAAFGQLSQMTGWLALDGNRHAAARRYFTTAVYAAHEAQQPALAASSLAYMSLQETYRGRLGSALSLARTASSVGNGSLTPLTKTMLGTRLARAHAGLRNTEECLRSLDEMREDFSNVGQLEEPLWISYVDEVEVAAQEGACYLDLGMATEAGAALTRALKVLAEKAPHRTRDRVHYLVRLARCYLLQREVERACEVAKEAVALSEAIGSARVVERLGEFHVALGLFAASQPAREFCELYASVMAQRSPAG
ncbi:MAG: helix-turn-helix domain-containing protein [Pseudonocardiaceae bacterium]